VNGVAVISAMTVNNCNNILLNYIYCVKRLSVQSSDVKRRQNLEAEAKAEAVAKAEAKALRPRMRPKFWPRGHFGLEDLTSLLSTDCGHLLSVYLLQHTTKQTNVYLQLYFSI